MIKLESFEKVFTQSADAKTLHILLSEYHKTKMFSLNHKQKLLIEEAHVYIGGGKLNKSCGSCLARGMNKIIQYCESYVPVVNYTTAPKITKTKVKAKSAAEEVPTNFLALKKYAFEKTGKKYGKGTKKADILKDLGL